MIFALSIAIYLQRVINLILKCLSRIGGLNSPLKLWKYLFSIDNREDPKG